jgi:hypothetical protein
MATKIATNDPSGREGARSLGISIAQYWRSRGYSVRVWIEQTANDSRYPVWAIRSDIGANGLPGRREVVS